MSKRKICVVTGTRAEYGLLYWLLQEIKGDKDLELQLLVTGMHLSPEFGLTYKNIENDGFEIDKKVEILLSSDTEIGLSKAIGLGCISFSEALADLDPDIMVVLGDRFEILAAAISAMTLKMPVAHIHGGETTEGAIDESIRHSITKMSHIHFPTTDEYKKRIIQLGENPELIFNFGAPGLDNIYKLNHLSRKELEQDLDINLNNKTILFTYHPETLEDKASREQIKIILNAISSFDYDIIFTGANADAEGRVINQEVKNFIKNSFNNNNYIFADNLGQKRYLSLLKYVDLMIGNSSSGIIEAPSFNLPVINIGNRQKGRIKAENIIDVECEYNKIVKAINNIRSSEDFNNIKNPYDKYGKGNTNFKIKEKLRDISLVNIINKEFFNIESVNFKENF